MDILSVESLSFSYGSGNVLSGVSFRAEKGDFISVLGGNGTGKSTLLKLIVGLLKPSEGVVRLYNKDGAENTDRRGISYISQSAGASKAGFPATVEEIVLANHRRCSLLGGHSKAERERAADCLDVVGLSDLRGKLIGELSGGQQQRVFIARALYSRPDLMLLDEPTAGIDTKTVDTICCLLARLNREQRMTVIMITHDLPSILTHSNKIIMFEGQGMAKMTANDHFQQELTDSANKHTNNNRGIIEV